MNRIRPPIRPVPEAVFFDLFDTICRIDADRFLQGMDSVAGILDLPFEGFFDSWVRAGGPSLLGELPTERDRFLEVFRCLGAQVPVARLDPAIAKYQEILLDATSLYPDATETLPALLARDDLKVGLISNATSSAQLMYLSLQLDRLFPSRSSLAGWVSPSRMRKSTDSPAGWLGWIPAGACLWGMRPPGNWTGRVRSV